jgi:histidinol-phosphate phosphatase family protein
LWSVKKAFLKQNNQKNSMIPFDKTWTLFLDRDGVINTRLPDEYVSKWDDFDFIVGSLKAIEDLSEVFGRIVVVTNQAGIGKGIMTEMELNEVHSLMLKTVDLLGGHIDKVYFAPDLPQNPSNRRKPNTGMALDAQRDFPEIDFQKSVIVGDSKSDIEMGDRLGMVKVFIEDKGDDPTPFAPHYRFSTLALFAKNVMKNSVLVTV